LGADIVCLQEITSGISIPGYVAAPEAVTSHRGACCTFVKASSGIRVLEQGDAGPCILTLLELPAPAQHDRQYDAALADAIGGRSGDSSGQIVIANCHLAPFGGNGEKRRSQVASIAQAAQRLAPGVRLLICGDTNMRENETADVLDMGLADAWVECGSDPHQRDTWDTNINQYYREGAAYTARYDRFMWPLQHDLQALSPPALVLDQPVAGMRGVYLSDHFGLMMTVGWE